MYNGFIWYMYILWDNDNNIGLFLFLWDNLNKKINRVINFLFCFIIIFVNLKCLNNCLCMFRNVIFGYKIVSSFGILIVFLIVFIVRWILIFIYIFVIKEIIFVFILKSIIMYNYIKWICF